MTRGLSCGPCQRAGRFIFNIFLATVSVFGQRVSRLLYNITLARAPPWGTSHEQDYLRLGKLRELLSFFHQSLFKSELGIFFLLILISTAWGWRQLLTNFTLHCLYCWEIICCTKKESSEYAGGEVGGYRWGVGVFHRETGSHPSVQHTSFTLNT